MVRALASNQRSRVRFPGPTSTKTNTPNSNSISAFDHHIMLKCALQVLSIKLVFIPFKIKSWFGTKDPIPAGLRSRVIYKFSCAGCSACYIGETNRHFVTRIGEHLAFDKHSRIFKHLRGSENCRSHCSEDCF